MQSFTLEEQEASLLQRANYSESDVFDGREFATHKKACEEADKNGFALVLVNPPCKRNHRIYTKYRHCLACNLSAKSHRDGYRKTQYVYIFQSKSTELVKIGRTDSVGKRLNEINTCMYANTDDWSLVKSEVFENAGRVENRIQRHLKDYLVNASYKKGRKVKTTNEVFDCELSLALELFDLAINNKLPSKPAEQVKPVVEVNTKPPINKPINNPITSERPDICPFCKKGTLVKRHRRSDKKAFMACSRYPNCKHTQNINSDSANIDHIKLREAQAYRNQLLARFDKDYGAYFEQLNEINEKYSSDLKKAGERFSAQATQSRLSLSAIVFAGLAGLFLGGFIHAIATIVFSELSFLSVIAVTSIAIYLFNDRYTHSFDNDTYEKLFTQWVTDNRPEKALALLEAMRSYKQSIHDAQNNNVDKLLPEALAFELDESCLNLPVKNESTTELETKEFENREGGGPSIWFWLFIISALLKGLSYLTNY